MAKILAPQQQEFDKQLKDPNSDLWADFKKTIANALQFTIKPLDSRIAEGLVDVAVELYFSSSPKQFVTEHIFAPGMSFFKMSPLLKALHDHPARVKGLANVTQAQRKDFLEKLYAYCENIGQHDMSARVAETWANVEKGAWGKATADSEFLVSHFHRGEMDAFNVLKQQEDLVTSQETFKALANKDPFTPSVGRGAQDAGAWVTEGGERKWVSFAGNEPPPIQLAGKQTPEQFLRDEAERLAPQIRQEVAENRRRFVERERERIAAEKAESEKTTGLLKDESSKEYREGHIFTGAEDLPDTRAGDDLLSRFNLGPAESREAFIERRLQELSGRGRSMTSAEAREFRDLDSEMSTLLGARQGPVGQVPPSVPSLSKHLLTGEETKLIEDIFHNISRGGTQIPPELNFFGKLFDQKKRFFQKKGYSEQEIEHLKKMVREDILNRPIEERLDLINKWKKWDPDVVMRPGYNPTEAWYKKGDVTNPFSETPFFGPPTKMLEQTPTADIPLDEIATTRIQRLVRNAIGIALAAAVSAAAYYIGSKAFTYRLPEEPYKHGDIPTPFRGSYYGKLSKADLGKLSTGKYDLYYDSKNQPVMVPKGQKPPEDWGPMHQAKGAFWEAGRGDFEYDITGQARLIREDDELGYLDSEYDDDFSMSYPADRKRLMADINRALNISRGLRVDEARRAQEWETVDRKVKRKKEKAADEEKVMALKAKHSAERDQQIHDTELRNAAQYFGNRFGRMFFEVLDEKDKPFDKMFKLVGRWGVTQLGEKAYAVFAKLGEDLLMKYTPMGKAIEKMSKKVEKGIGKLLNVFLEMLGVDTESAGTKAAGGIDYGMDSAVPFHSGGIVGNQQGGSFESVSFNLIFPYPSANNAEIAKRVEAAVRRHS